MRRPKANLDGTIDSADLDRAPPSEDMEQKGDLLIRDLWKNGTDSVHCVRVINTDTK